MPTKGKMGCCMIWGEIRRLLCRNMFRKIFAQVHGRASGGSPMHGSRSKDPPHIEFIFHLYLLFNYILICQKLMREILEVVVRAHEASMSMLMGHPLPPCAHESYMSLLMELSFASAHGACTRTTTLGKSAIRNTTTQPPYQLAHDACHIHHLVNLHRPGQHRQHDQELHRDVQYRLPSRP